jgi:predicted NAD/FAD-binding protein
VERILAALPAERFLTSRSVVSVSQSIPGASLAVTTADGGTERYDAVVLATHSDTALNILRNGTKGATELEERVLGAFSWSKNEAVLHSDVQVSYIPSNRHCCPQYVLLAHANQSCGLVVLELSNNQGEPSGKFSIRKLYPQCLIVRGH